MSRWQEKRSRTITETFAGIDVGKCQLDVFIHPTGHRLQVANTAKAIRIVIRELAKYDVKLAVLEATGKYHCLAHAMIHEAGIPVSVINPFRSRQFAESMGSLAKTDRIDAQMLASFAQRMAPSPTAPPEKQTKLLHELHTARRQVCDEVADLKRRLQNTDHALARGQIKERIALGERHKLALEIEIQALIASSGELKRRFDILTSIPNVGKITAAVMLADLSELGQANAKQIAALAGVAPMNWDSGKKRGSRMIRGGRKAVRNALYMCAVSATHRSDPLGRTYRALIKRGKNPKIALIAVMRKLVIIANTLVSENRTWEAEAPAP